jgi:uncharacterized protein YjbI with pentapeptide repeats
MPRVPKSPRVKTTRTTPKAEPAEKAIAERAHAARILRNREMPYAQLAECDLSGSDFFGTKLRHATFVKSRLVAVNFTGADLREADFSGADLTGAVLIDSLVVGARFETAIGLTDEQKKRLEKRGAAVRADAGQLTH